MLTLIPFLDFGFWMQNMVTSVGQIDDWLNSTQGDEVDRHEALKNPAQSRGLGAFAQLLGKVWSVCCKA
jgi:hypothetical protein